MTKYPGFFCEKCDCFHGPDTQKAQWHRKYKVEGIEYPIWIQCVGCDKKFRFNTQGAQYRSFCSKECRAETQNRDSESTRNRYLLSHYGINLKSYNEILRRQRGKCAICQRSYSTFHLHVDHDHVDGKIRGLLCPTCNHAIGWLEKFQENALEYLDREQPHYIKKAVKDSERDLNSYMSKKESHARYVKRREYRSNLTNSQARRIVKMFYEGSTMSQLAREFDVNVSTIKYVLNCYRAGKNYAGSTLNGSELGQ